MEYNVLKIFTRWVKKQEGVATLCLRRHSHTPIQNVKPKRAREYDTTNRFSFQGGNKRRGINAQGGVSLAIIFLLTKIFLVVFCNRRSLKG